MIMFGSDVNTRDLVAKLVVGRYMSAPNAAECTRMIKAY